MTICKCGGENRVEVNKLPVSIAKTLFSIDHELIERHTYCSVCGRGLKSIYDGTRCIKISQENVDLEDDE